MIKVLIGDMFQSNAQTLVNTVNCVGVMGKGVALEFKKRWPKLMEDYQLKCKSKLVKPGLPYLYTDMLGTSIINFPTKNHWRAASRLEDVESGLDVFMENYKGWGVTSVAFPPLGCGNGGLDWDLVGPLMYRKLAPLEIPVEIYAPYGTPSSKLNEIFLSPEQQSLFSNIDQKGSTNKKINPNWIAIIEVISSLEREPYANKVGRTIFQHICNIITAMGIDTELSEGKQTSGTLSDDVQRMLTTLANSNLITEKSTGRQFQITSGPEYQKYKTSNQLLLSTYKNKINKVVDLFLRIKNTEQAEEVATVLTTVRKIKQEKNLSSIPEQDVFDFITQRRKTPYPEEKAISIATTIRNLTVLGWIRVEHSKTLPTAETAHSAKQLKNY